MEVKSWSWIAQVTGHVARKKADWSLLEHGQATIPKELHARFCAALRIPPIPRGGHAKFFIEFEGGSYLAQINNVAREAKYGDTYKLAIQGSELPVLLKTALRDCYAILKLRQREANHTRATISGKNPAVTLDDNEADFVDFFDARDEGVIRLEVSYGAGEPLHRTSSDLDELAESRDDDPSADLLEFEQELDERFASGNYAVEDTWSRQKVRRAQAKFRKLARRNYGDACAMCGLDEPALLDAAHIRGWAESKDARLDPANGILLCVLHHRALDRSILAIAGSHVTYGKSAVKRRSPAYETCVAAVVGRELSKPRYWPLVAN